MQATRGCKLKQKEKDMSNTNKYSWMVVLAADYCGAKNWGAQSEQHAKLLAGDLAASGCEVIAIELV